MKFIRFLKTDIKIINSYFLIILVSLILVCVGYSSYALFSFSKTSPNTIELEVGEMTKTNLDTSGASVPVLASNMIPVYYDGTTYSGVAYPESKYYNSYTNTGDGVSPVTNYTNDMQHALTETQNWYSDGAGFVYSLYPWFERGGYYLLSGSAGVFDFGLDYGSAYTEGSVRLVITNE